MKIAILLLAGLLAAPSSAQTERSHGGGGGHQSGGGGGHQSGGEGQGGGRSGGGGEQRSERSQRGEQRSQGRSEPARAAAPAVIMKMRRVPVPSQPRPFSNPEHVVRDHNRAVAPERDEHGGRVTQPRATRPPEQHAAVVRSQVIVRNIQTQQRVEVVPGRYYWHNDEGLRYAHYYDRHYHWYGFYHGPHFYWTRYWADRWWWYDPGFGRWVFWHDGYWWWPGPGAAMYVYMNNAYYPYEGGTVVVKQPEVDQPPPAAAPSGPGSSYNSPDGRRMVQVYGDRAEAFLYDKTSSSPAFLTYLASGVEKARYTGGKDGKPLRILLDFKDGAFALYDADGHPVDSPTPSETAGSTEAKALPVSPPDMPSSLPPSDETAPAGAAPVPPAQ